ncbi:MAG: PAS domain S-box protein, partial [Parachlamydiaceae bacterium]
MTFNHLEEKTKEAKNGKSAEERVDALLAAFELFCQETSRLEQAYKSLQEEFKSVNLALDNTNKELESKVFELNRITHYLENILSHISQGLMFVGFNGIITTFNDAFEAMLGLKKSGVIGRKYDT